uniref:Reverse transcriptase domain-containing protein n=1 Tax=Cacopsylla melanoneura TaxID=428564 RepID=A0A8D8UZ39_9HEMI
MQNDLNSISDWLYSLGLNFHPDKCNTMTYTNKRSPIQNQYTLNGENIQQVETFKDLGVIFQPNLSFKTHINDISMRAYKRLGMLIRYCKYIQDIEAILLLYKSTVRSIMEYGAVLWSPKYKNLQNTIEKIQAKFIRYLFKKENGFYPKYPNYIDYKTLYLKYLF